MLSSCLVFLNYYFIERQSLNVRLSTNFTSINLTKCVIRIHTDEKFPLKKHAWESFQHTHFQLFSEDGPLSERGAVPAAVLKLKLALVDAHLRALSDHDDRVRPALADDPLPGRQSGNLVAYDARSQRQHGGETPTNDHTTTYEYINTS